MTPNITVAVKGDDLIITVKGAKDANFGPSKTGKNDIVASTFGNADVSTHLGAGARLGLNIYKPRKANANPST
jgi:hypothetical protein